MLQVTLKCQGQIPGAATPDPVPTRTRYANSRSVQEILEAKIQLLQLLIFLGINKRFVSRKKKGKLERRGGIRWGEGHGLAWTGLVISHAWTIYLLLRAYLIMLTPEKAIKRVGGMNLPIWSMPAWASLDVATFRRHDPCCCILGSSDKRTTALKVTRQRCPSPNPNTCRTRKAGRRLR